jgi:hypothetical protein
MLEARGNVIQTFQYITVEAKELFRIAKAELEDNLQKHS